MIWFNPRTRKASLVFLAGLLVTRAVLLLPLGGAYHQLSLWAVWTIAAIAVARLGYVWPALFLALSGAAYPCFLMIGFYIEWLGIAPIVADVFGISAFVALAFGGGGGKPVDHRGNHLSGIGHKLARHSVAMAARDQNGDRLF